MEKRVGLIIGLVFGLLLGCISNSKLVQADGMTEFETRAIVLLQQIEINTR